jgi:hypothetical protein
MKILDDVLSTLNFDEPVRDIRQGVFHTAVLTSECGLAATLPRDALGQESCLVRESGFLLIGHCLPLDQLHSFLST